MSDTYTITLPLPHKTLSPNYTVGSRGQRIGKSVKVKLYRECARDIALEVTRNARPEWSDARVTMVAYFPKRQFPDKDNFMASMKPAFDGLADAGIVTNDKNLSHGPTRYGAVNPVWPRVVLTIEKL